MIKNKLLKIFFLILLSITSFQLEAQRLKIAAPVDLPGSTELYSTFSADGTRLLVFRTTDGKTGKIVEFLHKTADNWTEINDFSELNTAIAGSEIKGLALNYNASRLYFGMKTTAKQDFDIYVSKRVENIWQVPTALDTVVNTKHNEAFPAIVPNEQTMYFAKQLINPDEDIDDENLECYLLFVAYKNPRGKWESPKALPVPVNLGCECSPSIMPDEKTLYFSSRREGGLGQFDIYYSHLITKNVWTTPQSITGVNTIDNELYPGYLFAEKRFNFTQIVGEKKNKTYTIYTQNIQNTFMPEALYILEGKIINKESGEPMHASLIIQDPISSRVLGNYENDSKTGDYKVMLMKGGTYKIDVFADESSHFFHTIEVGNIKQDQHETLNFELFKNFNLTFNIFDNELFEQLDGQIEVYEFGTKNKVEAEVINLTKGRYNIKLPVGKKVDIVVNRKYYEPVTLAFDATDVVQFAQFEKDVEMEPAKIDYALNIKDDETNQGIDVDITVRNLSRNESFTTKASKGKNGKYTIKLRDGDKYEINVSPKGYSFYNTIVDLDDDMGNPEEKKRKEILLTPMKKETKLTFNNITFEYNSADLTVSSYPDLDQILIFLQKNPQLKIEISAHTDDSGSDAYNIKLSERRAQSVVNYFVEREIPTEQLFPKGYGESKPAFPNDSEENRALNRRVELKIMEVNE